MVKNLVNKLRGGTKRARKFTSALGLSALLLFNGYFSNNCKSPTSSEIPDSNPIAILSVSPESGSAPLEVKVRLDGSPRENIVKYTLKIDTSDNLTGLSGYGISEPVGIDRAFGRPGVKTRIKESRGVGLKSRGIKKLGVREKVGSGREQLGRQIDPKTLEQTEIYEDPYMGAPETNGFERMLHIAPKENIQPYKMIVLGGSNGVEEILESNSQIDITRVYDNVTNEDIKIFFTGEVTGRDGRVSVPVSKNVIVSPRGDIYIAGTLKCNETGSAVRGMLKVFDSNRNLLETNKSDEEGYILTNSSGNFNFSVKRIASELEDIIIRAAHGTPGNPQSWVRTINIPAADNSNVKIVAVPYGEFKPNPNEFRNFMYEVTHDTGDPRMFDYGGFNKGFIIIKENLDDSLDNAKPEGKGKFTNEQVNYIKNIITPSKNNVEKILGTSNYSIKIQATSENYNSAGVGVIYLIPSTEPGGNPHYGGLFVPRGIENLMQGADIYIKDSLSPEEWGIKGVTLHEIGHTIYGPAKGFDSVMGNSGITYYTSLDLKGTDISYEKTYLRENPWEGERYLPVENLKYILGKSFDKWN